MSGSWEKEGNWIGLWPKQTKPLFRLELSCFYLSALPMMRGGIVVLRRTTTKKYEMWGYPTTPLRWLQSNTQESVNQWERLTEMTPLLGDVSWLMRCGGRVAVWTRTVESLDPVMIKPGLCHIEVIVPRGSWPKSKLWNFNAKLVNC